MRQYVVCKFRPSDSRGYTYHNDGEPVAVGDLVKVPDRSGEGWKRVEVVEVTYAEPPYTTKPILGRFEPERAPQADWLADADALQSHMESRR